MNNSTVCEQLLDGFNQGNWSQVREVLADDVHYHETATGSQANDANTWVELSQGWKSAFPNATGRLLNRIEAGTNQVIEEVMWSGTHDGDMHTPDGKTIPPTHKSMEIRAAMVHRVENGKVVETNHYFDMLSMLTQLGLA